MDKTEIEAKAREEWGKLHPTGDTNLTGGCEKLIWGYWLKAFQVCLSDTPVQPERWATDEDMVESYYAGRETDWMGESGCEWTNGDSVEWLSEYKANKNKITDKQ